MFVRRLYWRTALLSAFLLTAPVAAAPETPSAPEAAAPEAAAPEAAAHYTGDPISLSFEAAPVATVLEAFAGFTGLNFVTTAGAEATVTLRLEQVPWDQALELVLRAAGLAADRQGRVVWVAPAESIDKHEQRRRKAWRDLQEQEPLVSTLVPVHYARAADLAKLLKSVRAVDSGVQPSLFGSVHVAEIATESNSLLSPRGSVSVDQRTNTLLLQDTAARLGEVRKMIAELDRPVPQVLIETRIVEANGDFSKNLGVRLGLASVYHGGSGSAALRGRLGGTEPLAGDADPGDALGVDLAAPPVRGVNPGTLSFSVLRIGSHLGHLIGLELSALQAEGRGRIIASPRLVTADQQEAHIEQGQERVFTADGGSTLLGNGQIVTKKAVLGLTVTPRITPGERLILDVFITQDTFSDTSADTLNTKQLTTRVLLDNGETVMIGGIYQKENRSRDWSVPGLGKLPVVGRLFRREERFDMRSELLIFLTPHILADQSTSRSASTKPAVHDAPGSTRSQPRRSPHN